MFNMVIIIIGLIEFFIGVTITIFSKSVKVGGFIQFLYDFTEGETKVLYILNKWIGQNYGLIGSLYIFLASVSIAFDINWIVLVLAISLVEFISYKRINKGIKEILRSSQ